MESQSGAISGRAGASTSLRQLIESVVVPLLVGNGHSAEAHMARSPQHDAGPEPHVSRRGGFERPLDEAEVQQLAEALARGDLAPLRAALPAAVASRVWSAEQVLAPVARRLGEMWEDDEASFAQVGAALSALSAQFDRLEGLQHGRRNSQQSAPVILLASPQCEPHTFGLSVVGAAFEEAGWQVARLPGGQREDVERIVASGWVDVFGITASWNGSVVEGAELIRNVRQASLNPRIKVLAGGGAAAALDGADAHAATADQAVAQVRAWIGERSAAG
jgi:MerR family transcriptional regulator, light-induced transcriptional regulator